MESEREQVAEARKTYRTPELIRHGTVNQITGFNFDVAAVSGLVADQATDAR